jgi:Putative auto-transporter adhesin, head GIN domain
VRFSGMGDMNIAALHAERLDIEQPMPGACRINASGRVAEQHVSLRGMSDYRADQLDSKRATIALKGPGGHALIRAEDELDVTISGPGGVEYYGSPRVRQRVSPMGVVSRLAHP